MTFGTLSRTRKPAPAYLVADGIARAIAPCWEHGRIWTPEEEEALLGTMRDPDLARRLERSVSCVRTRRLAKTGIRFNKSPRQWTPAQLRLLGRLPDAEVGRRTGRFTAAVRNKRMQLAIPPMSAKRR